MENFDTAVENRLIYAESKEKTIDFGPFTYAHLIDRRIEMAPDVPLITYMDRKARQMVTVMPEQFRRQYRGVGAWLRSEGFQRTHIVIMGGSSYNWFLTYQAIVCSDNVAVLPDASKPVDILAEQLKSTDSEVLIYAAAFADKAEELKNLLGLKTHCLEDIPAKAELGEQLLAAGRYDLREQPQDEDKLSFLYFTSGTTGKNKRICLSQKNLLWDSLYLGRQFGVEGDTLNVLPMHHMFGSNSAIVPYIMMGKTTHICENIRYLYKDIAATNPEILSAVPLVLKNLYDTLWKDIRSRGLEQSVREQIEQLRASGADAETRRQLLYRSSGVLGNRLKAIISGGAPMDEKYFRGFEDFGVYVLQGYGLTETGSAAAVNPSSMIKVRSIGPAMAGCSFMIDQPNEKKEGEICIRGPIVMSEYYHDEESTNAVMKDGWFHSGDIGYIDADGYVYISGRIKNLIILSNGDNVSPEQLEQLIAVNPCVKEVVVYEKNNEIVAQVFMNVDAAEYVAAEDPKALIRDFVNDVNRTLPFFMRIANVEFRDIPFEYNSNHKLMRNSVI